MAQLSVNWLDIAIIVVLAGGLVLGMHEGLVRQALLLGAIYVSTVLAAQYYFPVADFLLYFFRDADALARSFVAFVLVFIVALAWMNWLSYTAYGATRLRSLAKIDKIGGAAFGIASAWLLSSVLVLFLKYGLVSEWAGVEPAGTFVREQVVESSLASQILSYLPLLASALRPWLPTGLPAPFIS